MLGLFSSKLRCWVFSVFRGNASRLVPRCGYVGLGLYYLFAKKLCSAFSLTHRLHCNGSIWLRHDLTWVKFTAWSPGWRMQPKKRNGHADTELYFMDIDCSVMLFILPLPPMQTKVNELQAMANLRSNQLHSFSWPDHHGTGRVEKEKHTSKAFSTFWKSEENRDLHSN